VLESDLAFSERWQGVSKNMRDSIRKARRRIEERGGAEIVVTAGGEIGEAFERFVQLEASGWKAGQGGALAQTPLERALWRDYLPIAPDAQIRELRIDGALAAAQITVSTARTLFLPRIAYDENLAELSPSNVLMAELLESCCGDPAIDRIDCMEWQPWHPRWGMVREPTYTLVAFNSATIRGNAARGARRVWELFNRAAVSPATARPTRRGGEHVDRWRARPRMTR
jgi:CelD/BcsL family acetyltransferase involved in cellulose biosynthesis